MRKNWDGNVFKTLYKMLTIFLEKIIQFIFRITDPEILSCTSQFLHKKDLKDSNKSYNLSFC